jgi:hypothetical protein
MLLLKFDLDDIEKCNSVLDVFRMFGIGVKKDDSQDLKLDNKEVFGKKAYYANMLLNEATYERIYKRMNELGEKVDNRHGGHLPTANALQWMNFSPISNGPRYKAVEDEIGEINESVLYIITPEDPFYEEDPNVAKSQEDE